jgi:K+-sensing histidine kinase KdpD
MPRPLHTHDSLPLLCGSGAIAGATAIFFRWFPGANTATVALSYLLVVLLVAASARLWVALSVSAAAVLAFNLFFLPPLGTLAITDPRHVVAWLAFLLASVVASYLSARERERHREALRVLEERQRAELSERTADLKSALLASVAHDVRTPLTAIRVAASNLQASWLDAPERAEQASVVLAEVERLTRLFQNVLDMAHIDAGALAAQSRWVHPAEIAEAARDQAEHALRAHRVSLVDASDDRLVHVDPRLTSAALAHVLENAAQYSRPGSTITVVHRLTAEGLLIAVEDEGGGIDPADAPHLFERFYRGGSAARRHASGTGMGLAITRGLLAAEQGRVWAENATDGGARFSILVPAASRPMAVAS